jgi:ParB/RepB/Spo0J family partition protein
MSAEVVHLINAEEVIVEENRQRQVFNKEKMINLINSINEFGQKQPGLCRVVDDKVILIFGERRLRACQSLKKSFKYLVESEVDPYKLKEIELLENVCRDDLTAIEQARAIAELHKLEQDQHGVSVVGSSKGHSIKDTASMLNMSPTKVSEELELAMFSELDEVKKAPNRTEARKIIKRLKEDFARGKALKEARTAAGMTEDEEEVLILEEEEYEGYDEDGEERPVVVVSPGEEAKAEMHKRLMFFEPFIKQGEMEVELDKLENESFDIVCFDPPWGVNFDTVSQENGGKQNYSDKRDVFLDNLEVSLQQIYRKMKQDSHLYLFFGIVHHEFIFNILERVGFSTNRIPLIWYKQGAHRTRNPNIWPGRSYEPIAFARKGNKKLIRKGAPDVIITSAPWNSLKKNHPSAKHPDIYLELLKRSAFPGDNVLDPMCGSGMVAVAAETMRPSHQLKWTMIEREENFVNLALFNLVTGYSQLIAKSSTPQERTEEDFHYMLPGTDEWREYWRDHPDEQPEMLEWKAEIELKSEEIK